jgi:hypothetical protein
MRRRTTNSNSNILPYGILTINHVNKLQGLTLRRLILLIKTLTRRVIIENTEWEMTISMVEAIWEQPRLRALEQVLQQLPRRLMVGTGRRQLKDMGMGMALNRFNRMDTMGILLRPYKGGMISKDRVIKVIQGIKVMMAVS